MHHLGLDDDALQQFQHLASYMLYPFDALRAPAKRLRDNQRGQSGLWAFGISGDLPILVLNVADERDLPVVREAMVAHAFWRSRGLKADLVILNEEASGYNQDLNEGLHKAATAVSPQIPHEQLFDQPGGIFMRANDKLTQDDLTLLLAVARVVLVSARGSLSQQLVTTLSRPDAPKNLQKRFVAEHPSAPLPFLSLEYFNSIGGFTPDGKEYAIYLGAGHANAAAVDQCFCKPTFWQRSQRIGSWLYMVWQFAVESPDAMEQRSDFRRRHRQHLYSRRREWRILDTDPAADSGKRCLSHAARARLFGV